MTMLLQWWHGHHGRGSSRLAAVRVDGELVVEVGDLTPRPGEEVVDCSGCLVLPGGIESHCHLDLECGPGLVTADDFATGTRSALAGWHDDRHRLRHAVPRREPHGRGAQVA